MDLYHFNLDKNFNYLISTFVHVEGYAILLLTSKQHYNTYLHKCGNGYYLNLFSRSETVQCKRGNLKYTPKSSKLMPISSIFTRILIGKM